VVAVQEAKGPGGIAMAFDVSFAEWILSAGTFLLGTVTPLILSRLTCDGISIGQVDFERETSPRQS
jgi:hypothetical protein